MAGIRVIFVLSNDADNESDASQTMVQAYDSCKQLVNNISWVKEKELSTIKFTKLDYLIFESFEGRDFSRFIQSKCAVVGPLAISVCLMEGKPIPSFQWPILNVAMYGCEVTCSNVPKNDKKAIQHKVQLMGGLYNGNLTDSITHLICNGTTSEKYMLAAEKGVKLMLPSWINHIFEVSQSNNVSANDLKLLEKFQCPPLHNLTICSTGITSSKERMQLSDVISANGGTLVAKLVLSKTDILICREPGGTISDKYKAARNIPHISCVTIDWVYDSVRKGHALPHEKYRVKTVTSTPTKDGENIDPNFSTISAIGGTTILRRTHIDDSVNITQMTMNDGLSSVVKKNSSKRKADNDLVENIDIKKIKNAGNFLDGCSVFVAGFSPTRRDKLNKIINISGATRYDEFSERVSHVIVGDPNCSEVITIKAMGAQCCLVSVQWLLDSVDQQKPADEEKYLVINVDSNEVADKTKTGSPLSKKVISFLRADETATFKEANGSKVVEATAENDDDPLTQKYLKNATTDKEEEDTLAKLLSNQDHPISFNPNEGEEFNIRTRSLMGKKDHMQENNQTIEFKPNNTSTQVSQVTTDLSESDIDVLPIFKSYKLFLYGFDEESIITYKDYIVAAGGTIADKRFNGVCDYIVCPIISKPVKLPPTREIVNELWLTECIKNMFLCTDIEYYHRPIELLSTSPLQGCVITISGYTAEEREFLNFVIKGLGGVFQEQLSYKNNEAKKCLASTHLVSPQASGKKYEAAVKWNVPVIHKDWLLECAKTGERVPVEKFFVIDSSSSENCIISNNAKSMSLNQKKDNGSTKNSPEEKNRMAKPTQSVSTPTNRTLENDASKTPINQIFNFDKKNTPGACSQVTPINKILLDAINSKVLPTPPSPKTYYPWNPKTPDTPIGAFIRPNPSPGLRKEMQKYVNSFPEISPLKKRTSTPLSELRKRLLDKVLGRGAYSQDDAGPSTSKPPEAPQGDKLKRTKQSDADESFGNEDPQKCTKEKQLSIETIAVHQKLQELQQRVMASGSSSATGRSSWMFESTTNPPGIEKTNVEIQSQICTVGWDYGEEKTQNQQPKIFMISGVAAHEREQLANHLKSLGALVSETSSYDASSTHLICQKPGRNEKTLACMAAGKWILHVSYVNHSVNAGQFLDEEDFEFGNPKVESNILFEEKDNSVYFWRKEVKRRGYGAFNHMRAIVIAEKKEPIANVIEAGGGIVINVKPPFDDSIHATHCLLEIKMVKDFSKYVVLAEQGIKCVNTIYINDFLWRSNKDDVDYIIPYFSKYYK